MITEELIKHLKQEFPLRSPRITDSDREIWVKVGHQEVISYLERKLEEIVEESLHSTTTIRS
jgi:hypothetical protein